jgi:hypothetical protein
VTRVNLVLVVAAIGSAIVAALLAASSLGIWMKGAYLHPTPRINSYTVGLGLVPLPALAWIVYFWARLRPRRPLSMLVLVAFSCVLVLVAGYCMLMSMFAALFVG